MTFMYRLWRRRCGCRGLTIPYGTIPYSISVRGHCALPGIDSIGMHVCMYLSIATRADTDANSILQGR